MNRRLINIFQQKDKERTHKWYLKNKTKAVEQSIRALKISIAKNLTKSGGGGLDTRATQQRFIATEQGMVKEESAGARSRNGAIRVHNHNTEITLSSFSHDVSDGQLIRPAGGRRKDIIRVIRRSNESKVPRQTVRTNNLPFQKSDEEW